MLLHKFSKDYGLNLAAAQAISQAGGNTNFGSPVGSEAVAGTGGGNTPSGGGGGGGVLGAAAAAAAQAAGAAVGALGNLFLSGSGGGGGAPPRSPGAGAGLGATQFFTMSSGQTSPCTRTLLGSPQQLAQQSALNTPMTSDDYELIISS